MVGEAYIPFGSTRVRPAIEQIVAAKPDMILNTINGSTNVTFFHELRAAGISSEEFPTLSFSVSEEQLRRLDIDEMVGDYTAWTYFQSIDNPENHEFLRAFRQRFGQQRVLTDPMEAAYVGVKLWAKAVEEAKQHRAARHPQRHAQPAAARARGDVRVDAETQHLWKTPRIGRVRPDGRFEVVWTAPAPEAPEPYPPSRTAADWKAFLHDLQRGWNGQWTAPSPSRHRAERAQERPGSSGTDAGPTISSAYRAELRTAMTSSLTSERFHARANRSCACAASLALSCASKLAARP